MAQLKKLDAKFFNKKLLLNQWLLMQFGIAPLESETSKTRLLSLEDTFMTKMWEEA